MKTLVTGGAGFIGHYLVKKLLEEGAEVRVLDDLSKGELVNLEGVMSNPRFEFVKGNLLDEKVMKNATKNVDIIFHLAAKIGGIVYFHKIPATLLRDNDKMTFSVFEAARENKTKIVYLSSSMVFERAKKFPSSEKYLEECPPPITSYGFSKLSGEYIARAYNQEFGIPFAIVRPFNAYGPGEAPGDYVGYSHVIPDLVKKISESKNEKIEILGNGSQTRCFTYAEDIASGISLVGKNAINEDFNIGTSEETRMDDLAHIIWRIMKKPGELRLDYRESYADDVLRRVPDCSKMKRVFGWKPRVSLEEGLTKTVSWLTKKMKIK